VVLKAETVMNLLKPSKGRSEFSGDGF